MNKHRGELILEIIGAGSGALVGLQVLRARQRSQKPCGFCRKVEELGWAELLAAGIGALVGWGGVKLSHPLRED